MNRAEMSKNAQLYLELPYAMIVKRDKRDNIYVARVEEFPGCVAHGETIQDTLKSLRENMRVWIQDCLDSGDPVPSPYEDTELPSGKWVQRVPRSLHLKLVHRAGKEGVSLNQFVTSALAEAVGTKTGLELSMRSQGSGVWSVGNWYGNWLSRGLQGYQISTGDYGVDPASQAFEVLVKNLAGAAGPMELNELEYEGSFHAEIKAPAVAVKC